MNAPLLPTPHVEPFFFDAEPGTRFSLYHAPNPHVPARGAMLYVHPFAEELNATRRMAQLQARRFAGLGYAVLQIDLFGCGDSCGDFNAARWDQWRRDLLVAYAWLSERSTGPMRLWGLRLGGLLALDFASSERALTADLGGIVLWQPLLHGRTCINQFLRQRLVQEQRLATPGAPRSTAALRTHLLAHGTLEVCGYEVSAALAQAIDAIDAAQLQPPPCTVHWFASGADSPAVSSRLRASAARLAERWAGGGATLELHLLTGVPFWNSAEQNECAALLDATSAVFAGGAGAGPAAAPPAWPGPQPSPPAARPS